MILVYELWCLFHFENVVVEEIKMLLRKVASLFTVLMFTLGSPGNNTYNLRFKERPNRLVLNVFLPANFGLIDSIVDQNRDLL